MAGIGTYQIVDDVDLTTVRFDMNDASGAANPGGLKTVARELHLRLPELEAVRFAPSARHGGRTLSVRDPLAVTTWKQAVLGSANNTYDEGAEAFNELTRLLRAGGVIKFTPEGSTDGPRYIDFEPSDGVALFGDDPEDVFRAITSHAYPEGALITIVRQPHLRVAELDPAVNVLTNPTLLIDRNGDGRPDNWSWAFGAEDSVSVESIHATTESYQFTAASGAIGPGAELLSATTPAVAGEVWTASIEVIRVSSSVGTPRLRLGILWSGGIVNWGPFQAPTTFTRVTLTDTAPVGTTTAALIIEFEGSATGTWRHRRGQLEKSSSASRFRCSAQAFSNDPTVSGQGRIIPIWIEGDAPCPIKFKAAMGSGANTAALLYASRLSKGVVGNRRLVDLLNRHHFRAAAATVRDESTVVVTESGAVGGTALETRLRVQHNSANGNSTAPSVPWPAASTLGNYLLLVLFIDVTAGDVTVTPPGGWTEETNLADDGLGVGIKRRCYRIENAAVRSGAETSTLSLARPWWCALVELDGIVASGTLDLNATGGRGTSTSPLTALSTASIQPEVYLLAFVGNKTTATQSGPTNNFAQFTNTTGSAMGGGLYERIVFPAAAATSYQMGATLSASADWSAALLGVKLAGPFIKDRRRRFRQEVSTKLDSLRGDLDAYLRCRPLGPESWTFTLLWTPSLGAASLALPTVSRSFMDAGSSPTAWVEVPLGTITVPEEVTLVGVSLELWAERIDSAVDATQKDFKGARFDSLLLVPRDTLATVVTGAGDSQKSLGSELVTPVISPSGGVAGTVLGTEMTIGSSVTAGAPPKGGSGWTAGLHRFRFKMRATAANSVLLAVRNMTDNVDTASQTVSVRSDDVSQTFTVYATLVAGKSYQPQVRSASGSATAREIARAFTPVLATGQVMATDAGASPPAADVQDSAGALLSLLAMQGPTPDLLEPGLNILHVALLDPEAAGFADRESLLARTGTLSVTHSPRFYE